MPYKSRRTSFRRYPKKKVSKTVKKYVKKVLDYKIEDKNIHNDLTAIAPFQSIGNSWDTYLCCNPSQGTTAVQRIGRKIHIKSVELYGVLSAGDNSNCVRIAMYTSDTSNALSGVDIDWKLSRDRIGGGNFGTLYYDKYIPLQFTPFDGATASGVSQQKIVRIKKVFKRPIPIVYSDDTTGTYNKQLCISVISDSAAVPHPGFTRGYVITRFEDA